MYYVWTSQRTESLHWKDQLANIFLGNDLCLLFRIIQKRTNADVRYVKVGDVWSIYIMF